MLASTGDLADVERTGSVLLLARTVEATTSMMVRSFALTLVLITPLMTLQIDGLRVGLVRIVTDLVPILTTQAWRGVLGVELDMFSALGAWIAVGLALLLDVTATAAPAGAGPSAAHPERRMRYASRSAYGQERVWALSRGARACKNGAGGVEAGR